MAREHIAQALRRLRGKSGLTADEVGALVGKTGKAVSAWENNRGQPDADTLMLLCDIYHVENILAEFSEEQNKKSPSKRDELCAALDKLNKEGLDKLEEYIDFLLHQQEKQ